MDYQRIVQNILDMGEAMLQTGAENFRIDDSLYRMCRSYGFVRYDVFVIPSNIQITVETPEGDIITQIRHIESTSINYDQLDRLNDLSRYVCANQPGEQEFHRRFLEVIRRPEHCTAVRYAGTVMGAVGFGVMCGCDGVDALVAGLTAILITYVGSWLNRKKVTLLIYNMLLSFLAELVILQLNNGGIPMHPERITIGIVFLLISGLGVSTGIREVIQRDFISGTLNIMNSLLGAAGISMGIAFAILLCGNPANGRVYASGTVPMQILFSFIGSLGFALLFNTKGDRLWVSSLGGMLCQAIYLLVYHFCQSNFTAVLVAATCIGGYAFVMSRVLKAVSTIFLSVSSFPLVPGASLYYLMYGVVTRSQGMVEAHLERLLTTCLGIALGYILMDVISGTFLWIQKKEHFFDLKKSK